MASPENTNIFSSDQLKNYITYNKNFLYDSIDPIISAYKNKININETIRKSINKHKTPKILRDEDGLKYQISKNAITPTFSNSSSLPEDDTSSVVSEKNNYDILLEKLEEFSNAKLIEVNKRMKRFNDIDIIDISNIKDVSFGLSNFCAFLSINLSLCPSLDVVDRDEMIEEFINLVE